MDINITDQERQLLLQIVERYRATLREEIHNTDAYQFKEELKAEEMMIKSILEKLRAAG